MQVISLAEIGREIMTQDNLCTADPFFIVQERTRHYGIDIDYDPQIAWLYDDESVEVSAEKAEELEAQYRSTYKEPEGFRRVGYVEEWQFVTGCFTAKAAEEFIERNKHRHNRDLRVYAETLYRNHEMIAIRNALICMAAETAVPGVTRG